MDVGGWYGHVGLPLGQRWEGFGTAWDCLWGMDRRMWEGVGGCLGVVWDGLGTLVGGSTVVWHIFGVGRGGYRSAIGHFLKHVGTVFSSGIMQF